MYFGDGENKMTAGSCETGQNGFFHILVQAELIEGQWGKQEVGGGLLGNMQGTDKVQLPKCSPQQWTGLDWQHGADFLC